MRAIDTITLRFGLVNIPLRVNSIISYKKFGFKQLCPNCHSKISHKLYCEKCQKEICYQDLEYGFEISKSNMVLVDREKFQFPKEAKIITFIKTNSEPEIIQEKCYLLTPKGIAKPYFLLLKLLRDCNKSIIVEYVLRKTLHLGIIKPVNINGYWYLLLKQIVYSDAIKEIEELKEEKITEEELSYAKQLFEIMYSKTNKMTYWDIKDKRLEILEKMLSGKIKVKEKKDTEEFKGLMEQLKKSVELEGSNKSSESLKKKVRKVIKKRER